MAKTRMDLTAFVGKLLEEQDGNVLREGIPVLSQALMLVDNDNKFHSKQNCRRCSSRPSP